MFTFEAGGATNIPADPFGGEDDLSFQFRSMWTPLWDVYFLVEVTDDIAMDDAQCRLFRLQRVEKGVRVGAMRAAFARKDLYLVTGSRIRRGCLRIPGTRSGRGSQAQQQTGDEQRFSVAVRHVVAGLEPARS